MPGKVPNTIIVGTRNFNLGGFMPVNHKNVFGNEIQDLKAVINMQ